MLEKLIKTVATLLICSAGVILTGKVYAIIMQPEMNIWEFIFLSENALYRHYPLGIVIAGIAYLVIKNSMKVLFSLAVFLILAAVLIIYVF